MTVLEWFIIALLCSVGLSLLAIELGWKFRHHPRMSGLSQKAYQQKISALEKVWPLTRVRGAVRAGRRFETALILSSLILAKSFFALLLGAVVVFWLPFAAFITPAIVAHDSEAGSSAAILRTSRLQVVSHCLAAAVGFAVVMHRVFPGSDLMLAETLGGIIALAASAALAAAAGYTEASWLVRRGDV